MVIDGSLVDDLRCDVIWRTDYFGDVTARYKGDSTGWTFLGLPAMGLGEFLFCFEELVADFYVREAEVCQFDVAVPVDYDVLGF